MSIVQRPKVEYNSGIDTLVDKVMTASGRFKEDGLVKSFEIVFSKNSSTTSISPDEYEIGASSIPLDEYEIEVSLRPNRRLDTPITIFVTVDFSKKLNESVAAVLKEVETTSMKFMGELHIRDIRALELGESVRVFFHRGYSSVYMNLESSIKK